jgi:hypothetical protein
VEGRVRLAEPNVGTGWADFGLAKFSQIPGAPNALFLTDNSSGLFANDYQPGAGGPVRTTINGFDLNQFHDVRLVLNTNRVDYYIDGVLQVSHPLGTSLTTVPLHLWFFTQFANYDLVADWLRLARYPSSGQFTSCPMDMGSTSNWGNLTWLGETPAGAGVTFETRSSADASNWSTWAALGANGAIGSPASRYLQYRATLTTSDLTLSPQIDEVNITATGASALTLSDVQGAAISPTAAQISWQTDQLADTQVAYGLTTNLGTVVNDAEFVNSHAVSLPNLQSNTVYYYQVTSVSTSGQSAQSQILSFTTPGASLSQTTMAQFGQGAS